MSKKCTATKENGKPCGAWALSGKTKCAFHSDPERAARMGSKHGRKTTLSPDHDVQPLQPPKTAKDVRNVLADAIAQVHARKMDVRIANSLAYISTSLLRAIEVSDLESQLAAFEQEGREHADGNTPQQDTAAREKSPTEAL